MSASILAGRPGFHSFSLEPVGLSRFEGRRGWTQLIDNLPAVVRHLHYRTDAVGLIVVADSNGSALHAPEHEKPGATVGDCRLCQLRQTVEKVRSALRPRLPMPPLEIAMGLAAPAIEAWYLCGQDPTATEAAWNREPNKKGVAPERIRALKRKVYGTDHPSLDLETEKAVAAAERLAADLATLQQHFPIGFGALARDVRSWREAT